MCLALGATGLTGCTGNEAFTEKSYTVAGEEITGICIDVRDRQIEVALSPDSQVHIDYFESSKAYYDISVSDNHTLAMTAASDKAWTDYIGGYDDYVISCKSKKGESNLPPSKEGGTKMLAGSSNNGDINIAFV